MLEATKLTLNIFKNIPHYRGRYGAAVIDPGRLVDGNQGDDFRILGRGESDKTGNVLFPASGQLLRRGRLAADAPLQADVALPGVGYLAVGHDEVVSLQPESQPVVEPEVHACSHREGQEVTAVAALLVEVVGEVPLHLFGVEAFQPVVADGEVLVQVVRPGTQEGVDVG